MHSKSNQRHTALNLHQQHPQPETPLGVVFCFALYAANRADSRDPEIQLIATLFPTTTTTTTPTMVDCLHISRTVSYGNGMECTATRNALHTLSAI